MNDKKDSLDNLEEGGLIVFDDDTGLPSKNTNKHLRPMECCCMILEYVIADCKVSSREIARKTGLDARSVNKYRGSEMFAKLLIEYTNKRMLNVRSLAVEKLEQMLNDDKLNPNIKIKAIHEALSHSERMTELMLLAKENVPVIDVSQIIRELDEMDE